MNNFQHPYGKVNNATVDFITFTTKPNNPSNEALVNWFKMMQEEELMNGSDCKELAPQGYQGFKTDHIFYGEGKQGFWFIVSSDPADHVARELLAMNVEIKITRLDVQTTILTDEPWKDFASFMRDIVRANEAMDEKRDRMTINLIESDGKGDTCYVGAKDSARRLTIYDKTLQQKRRIEGNQYRFEIRLRGKQASEVWKMMLQATELSYLCMSLVAGALLNAGLPVPWEDATEPVGLPSTYHMTTEQRRYEWIINQVIPAFRTIENPLYIQHIKNLMGF
jgi:hypothetical protein